jgi:hypothetical protein
MTDSPAPRIPLDPKEQPILDKLLEVRTKLELLKQDRSTYVKSQDIVELYNEVIHQVCLLNDIRTTKRLEQNRGSPSRAAGRLISGHALTVWNSRLST